MLIQKCIFSLLNRRLWAYVHAPPHPATGGEREGGAWCVCVNGIKCLIISNSSCLLIKTLPVFLQQSQTAVEGLAWLNLFNAELSAKKYWQIVSHFNVSLIVRDKVTRQCLLTTTLEEERRAEAESNRAPSAYQPSTLLQG